MDTPITTSGRYDIKWTLTDTKLTFHRHSGETLYTLGFSRAESGVPIIYINSEPVFALGRNLAHYACDMLVSYANQADIPTGRISPVPARVRNPEAYTSKTARNIFSKWVHKHFKKVIHHFILSKLTPVEYKASFWLPSKNPERVPDIDKYTYADMLKYRAAMYVCINWAGNLSQKSWRDYIAPNRNKFINISIDKYRGSLSYIGRFSRLMYQHPDLNQPIINPRLIEFLCNSPIPTIPSAKDWNKFLRLLRKDNQFFRHGKRIQYLFARASQQMRDYLNAAPGRGRQSLPNLYLASKRWHDEVYKGRNLDGFEETTPVQSLPFEIDVPGVKFLSTVGEIVTEGMEMKHCVGSFVKRCVAGESFIFSCEHQGDRATIEVVPTFVDLNDAIYQYVIRQSYGPHNTINKASEYARQEINKQLAERNTIRDPQFQIA